MQRRFILLAQAYQVLADPDQRRAYDRRRAAEGGSPSASSASGTAAQPQPARSPAEPARSRPAGSGPAAAAAEFSADSNRRGASGQPAPAQRSSPRPAAGAGAAELREILQEVEQSLSKFGLDLRQPTEVVLEELADWARSLYRDLVGAVRNAQVGSEPEDPPRPSGRPPRPSGPRRGEAGHAHVSSAHAGRNAQEREDQPTHELAVERELEQLKQGVRTGTSPRRPTIDEELAELKRQRGSKPTAR